MVENSLQIFANLKILWNLAGSKWDFANLQIYECKGYWLSRTARHPQDVWR
jgi:hypothetical protein